MEWAARVYIFCPYSRYSFYLPRRDEKLSRLRPGSNPQPVGWEASALPPELSRPYYRLFLDCTNIIWGIDFMSMDGTCWFIREKGINTQYTVVLY